MLEEFNFFFPL